MEIRIISTESLGTRGMCAMVKTKHRRILIDPGIALGWLRQGLLPHPCQIERGAEIRERIVQAYSEATDIVFSHYHGDHIPLAKANPYQLSLQSVTIQLKTIRLWGLNPEHVSPVMRSRAKAIETAVDSEINVAEGLSDAELRFSEAMPHGTDGSESNKVMMTRIEEDGHVFVHASDIQLTETDPVERIIDWHPDEVFVSGPPFYLQRISSGARTKAGKHALALAEKVPILIIDHHLLRSREGVAWLDKIQQKAKNRVICAADYHDKKRRFLEADRKHLYNEIPVPDGWHEAYEQRWNRIRPGE